jgi:hypothetical protein
MTTITDEIITEVFKYWSSPPALSDHTDVTELRNDYESQDCPTHWFDPDTLRFFGSRNLELAAPGIMIELQTNAPDGVDRYAVTAWVIGDDDKLSPTLMERCSTREGARLLADALHATWPTRAQS